MKLAIFVFLCFFAIESQAQSIFERLQPPLVGAHQGGYPWKGQNNTVPKFLQALKDGANIVEMDLRLTKDNVVLVYHDESLNSDTSCKGLIRDLTYAQTQNCGKRIEKFEDILRTVNGHGIINGEFKVPEVIIPAIQLVQKYNAHDWVYFQTKADRSNYILARETDDRIALNYKAVNDVELDWALSQNDPYLAIIEMEKNMANPKNLRKVHDANKLVSVNSWRYGSFEELFSAACDKVFKLGIDIAAANNISGCVKQKKFYKP